MQFRFMKNLSYNLSKCIVYQTRRRINVKETNVTKENHVKATEVGTTETEEENVFTFYHNCV